MHRLEVPRREFEQKLDQLDGLAHHIGSLPIDYQKIASEIVILRLFELQQEFFKGVAFRLACGAEYLDGAAPSLIHKSNSVAAAESAMRTLGRSRAIQLRWSKASDISGNLKYVFDPSDHFVKTVRLHGGEIDELRRVRNRVAHNNPKSRNGFRVVVKKYYGGTPNAVTPGLLLLSPRHAPSLLHVYLSKARILSRTSVRH